MSQNKIHLIRSDRGSCLTSFGAFLLVLIFLMLWIATSIVVEDQTSAGRDEMFRSDGLTVFFFLFGIAFHEFCHYACMRLFGGSPHYSGRKFDPNRTYLQRKYLSTVIMRFWSPGTKFTFAQYLLIVLSPTIIVFGFFPTAMLVWQNSVFHSILWIVGFVNSALIAFDILIALRLLASGSPDYLVVDESEGTYLVKR